MKLNVFVYGTLKKGYGNHQYHCEGCDDIIPAYVRGRIYDFGPFPQVQLFSEEVLQKGSNELVSDTVQGATFLLEKEHGLIPQNERVYGEIIVFNGDSAEQLYDRFVSLDRLEGFPSFYDRSLVVAKNMKDEDIPVWIYHSPNHKVPDNAQLLESGSWY